MNVTFTSKTTRNNSSFFATLQELFKVLWLPKKVEWERERKYSGRGMEWEWKSCQLTYRRLCSPSVGLRDWGRREGERERESEQELRGVTWKSTHTYTPTHPIYLYQLTPVLIFPLYPSNAFSLLHFTSHSLNCFVLFTDSTFPDCYFRFMCFM